MVNDFRRDHSFRNPRPDQSVKYGTPNACNKCHTDQSADWAAKAVEKWYGPDRPEHFSNALLAGSTRQPEATPALIALIQDQTQPAIARATAVWYLGQIGGDAATFQTLVGVLNDPDPMVRIESMNALMVLSQEERLQLLSPLLRDPIRSVRITAANGLADLPPELFDVINQQAHQQALKDYETYLSMNADFPMGQISKAQYYERTQQREKAKDAYKYALKQDELAHAAGINLASLYNADGQNQEALNALQTIIKLEPTHGQAYYSLGLLYAEMGRMDEAVQALQKATEYQPENPRAFYNLGLAQQNMQRVAAAERAYQAGLKQHPDQVDLMYALCILYIQQNQMAKATPLAQRLNEIAPNVQEFQQLLGYVQGQ
jgi:tetratricopeptide (TPR) repeat protein